MRVSEIGYEYSSGLSTLWHLWAGVNTHEASSLHGLAEYCSVLRTQSLGLLQTEAKPTPNKPDISIMGT